MKFKILKLLAFMTIFWFPFLANAATYNWYFSNNSNGNAVGNDTTGNGSFSRPWKTLSKAQAQINTLGSSDTANLYFDRGDTWTMDTTQKKYYHFLVDTDDPVVHIDAYGSGNRPVFDGSVSDFSTADPHNASNGPFKWNRVFDFRVLNCSMANVEIKNVYGHAIFLVAADGFTLSNSKIHNFGSAGITNSYQYGIEDCTVEHSEFHTGQQAMRYRLRVGWEAAITFTGSNYGNDSMCKNNLVRYNLVYDIYGEGINAPNSITEYNVVGDTLSIGINTSQHDFDALTAIVRYNYLIMSDWSTSAYYGLAGAAPHGIRVYDEQNGGDNSAADISIYGNIIINRARGIRLYCYDGGDTSCGQTYGSVKIYNNTIIDCRTLNMSIYSPSEFPELYVYNNLSILYDRTRVSHVNNITPGAGWDIGYNHFWTKGGSPNVPSAWQANHVTTDPKLPGEPALKWDGLIGTNYFYKIDFENHLYISPNSSLVNAGKILGSGYNSMFLADGTDFSKFNFNLESQPKSAKWHIGAIIPENIGKPNANPKQPAGFRVMKK